MKKKATSLRLTEEGKRLLEALSQKLGVNQTAVIELLIREKAKKEGLK
jgi:predicted DNA-binding protein